MSNMRMIKKTMNNRTNIKTMTNKRTKEMMNDMKTTMKQRAIGVPKKQWTTWKLGRPVKRRKLPSSPPQLPPLLLPPLLLPLPWPFSQKPSSWNKNQKKSTMNNMKMMKETMNEKKTKKTMSNTMVINWVHNLLEINARSLKRHPKTKHLILKSSFNGVLFFERDFFEQNLEALQIGNSQPFFEHESLKKQ